MKRVRMVLGAMALGALAAAAALGLSGHAHADTGDDAVFLMTLASANITSDGGTAGLLSAGHIVCALRAAGYSETQVINHVYANTRLDRSASSYFVGAAEETFCPGEA